MFLPALYRNLKKISSSFVQYLPAPQLINHSNASRCDGELNCYGFDIQLAPVVGEVKRTE
jgi:hypothetical protein